MPTATAPSSSSAPATAPAPAPADPANASTSTKRKRTRTRRGKNKTRTADADDNSDDNDDDDQEAKESADPKQSTTVAATEPAPVPTPRDKAATPAKAAADVDDAKDSGDEDEGEGDDGKRKRKRKRARANKKGSNKDENLVKAVEAQGNVGPDPELDLRLSEHAKKAIEYARVYSSDRASWKFNKAKQNWLLRNALACPPADYDPELATRKPAAQGDKPSEEAPTAAQGAQDGQGDAAAADKEKPEEDEGENFIPEVFVPVVTAYLKSVMGAAKQRLVETLKEALNAPVPETAAAETVSDVDAAASAPAAADKSTGKSVSFGAMAMEAEKTADAAAAATNGEGEASPAIDARTLELRRQRAKRILAGMGELP
ncbi:uncharacterized protein PFL1_03562 [Pseudozyma flocculosa PF-1]|uniref:WKF domain-containing protein n=2 Tax=Pseudozyma flocculosa TaxID=84751 RepID=A0A5C3F4M9_9BASI|nr:uncharacterized protein PFL1_03562 [Pseudozyma flocculosa PF-1]EPQ28759.1 hypothetical protein PFL1_03562 [Pseudozyma flocculosa PF-1]SPO39463.1 uncharacterized protein PSFLO_04944 [Pseudozyma flocculosa]